MFKSKLFIKAMFIVCNMIIIFTLAIYFFAIPKVEDSFQNLEESHAKETLNKVVLLVKNVQKNLLDFEQRTYTQHKNELKLLTETIYSLVENKYEQSKEKNIANSLEKKALEFNENLQRFYLKNKNILSEEELKKALINYINIYRYSEGTGYFVLTDLEGNIISHPILTKFNNKKNQNQRTPKGTFIIQSLIKQAKDTGKGILNYEWPNPKSLKNEKKIAYSFIFKPYNWMIMTGEYYDVLKLRLQKEVFTLISKMRYGDNSYFFISNYKNVMVSHPYYQGRDFTNILDKDANLIIPLIVEQTRKYGDSFTSYYWSKDKHYENPLKKFTYSKDFPKWEIIISTGFYIDEVQKELKIKKAAMMEQLREIIVKTKLGKTGYLYIFNKAGKMLIHPNSNLHGNENFYKLKTPSGYNIYDELVNASTKKENVYAYKWDKPEDKNQYIYDKKSWVEYIPELDWYIGSSVYIDEFKASANEVIEYILKIAFIVLLLSLAYSLLFFRNLLQPISVLSKLIINVSKGDYSKRAPNTNRKDEIGILSIEFNEMLNTIENKNLELEDSNNELEETINNLKKTQDRLVEAEKMASLKVLVSGVAHEINTPVGVGLTAITHLRDLCDQISISYNKDLMSKEDFEEYLKTSKELSTLIEVNLNKTAKLIRSFKQIEADQNEDERREFNLKEYCDEVLISINSIVAQTSISLSIDCPDNIVINSYPGAFSHIMSNLITNSIRHGFKEHEKGKIHFAITLKETYVQILYHDNGKGIPKENFQKVFDPFFTTNRKEGGSGLGLNIIYNIVKKGLNGNITCEPCEKGVLFKIIIPL